MFGLIAFILLVAFMGRVSVTCINGGSSASKSQQVLTEDNEEQSDKQPDGKFKGQKFTEFISPAYMEMPCMVVNAHVITYPAHPFPCVLMPLITVITPPPDITVA